MSTINTNGINVNYPVPGQNQSSQGFRNNFNSIVTNLNIAATEITDLQTNAVLKAALANTTLNNDMANTLISNAATRSFRATTYNLGNALSGTAIVNASLADVQYGAVAGDVTLQFGNWSPTGTQQSIQLQLAISNANAVITFPASVASSNNNSGVTSLENYANVRNYFYHFIIYALLVPFTRNGQEHIIPIYTVVLDEHVYIYPNTYAFLYYFHNLIVLK